MVSRRDFLFSAVRRVRQNVDEAGSVSVSKPVSGIGQKISEADDLFGQGRWQEARDVYKEVLAREPHHIEARVQVMICHYKLGEINPAKVCARQVLLKDPDNHTAKLFLGLAWLKKDNLEKAMEAWEGYFDTSNPRVLREVNVHKALFETGEALDCQAVAREIERVMA
jgi:tetratricopeptide (TPR) repeat protein